jgi:acyl carrier protein
MEGNMEQEICRIIEEALGLEVGSVNVNDTMDTIEKWDSIGFLSILSALEQRFGNKVASIDSLASVKSVREIIDVLKERSVI